MAINVDTCEKRIVIEGIYHLAAYDRVAWSGNVICYATMEEDNILINYENKEIGNRVSLIIDKNKNICKIKANKNFIAWQELAGYNDYSNSKIVVYDIKENKTYRYNPEEDFLLFQLCDNGCLINISSNDNDAGSVREWNVKEEILTTIYEKEKEKNNMESC